MSDSDVEHDPKRGPGPKKLRASGAAKRRRRLQIESEKAKLPKVTSFFQQQRQPAPEDVRVDGPPSIPQTDKCDNVAPQDIEIEQLQLHDESDTHLAQADVVSEVVDHDASGSGDELNLMCNYYYVCNYCNYQLI